MAPKKNSQPEGPAAKAPAAPAQAKAKPKAAAPPAVAAAPKPKAETKAAAKAPAQVPAKAQPKAQQAQPKAQQPKAQAKGAPSQSQAPPAAVPETGFAEVKSRNAKKKAKAAAAPAAPAPVQVQEEPVDFGPDSSWEAVEKKATKQAQKKKEKDGEAGAEPKAKPKPAPEKQPVFKDFKAMAQPVDEKKTKEQEVKAKAREAGQQVRIKERIAEKREVPAEDLKDMELLTKSVDLSPEVTAVPFLYQRRFEKEFGLLIERPDGGKGGGKGAARPPPKSLVVHGVEQKQVDACVRALKALDFSAKQVIQVSAKQAVAVMGYQQTNARKIEEEFKGVFLHSERNQVTLYGPSKEVSACLKHVNALIPEEKETITAPPMSVDKDRARALIGASGKNVQKIESDTGTNIKVVLPKREDDRDDEAPATIKISGEKDKCEKAKGQIEAFFKSLDSVLVEAAPDVLARLFESMRPSKGKGKGKGKGKEEPDANAKKSKFVELYNSGLTVLRKGKGVMLLGEKSGVGKWKSVLNECIAEVSNPPDSIKVNGEQAKLWNAERLEGLRTSTGATVRVARRQGQASLEITGTDEEKEKVKAAIEEMLENIGHVETIENASQSGVRLLMAKSATKLKELEQQHEVSITVDKKNPEAQKILIMGAKDAVEKAKVDLEGVLDSAASALSKEITIGWDDGKVVIGRGGNTVRQIKLETGLDDLQVDDGETGKRVMLKGSAEAMENAEKMINEIIAKAKDSASSRAENNKGEGKGAEKGNGKKTEGKPRNSENKEGEKPAPRKGGGKGGAAAKVNVHLESTEFFPTLGGGNGAGAAPKGAWKKEEAAAAEAEA